MPELVYLLSGGAFVYGLSNDMAFVLVHVSGDELKVRREASAFSGAPAANERDHSIARSPGDWVCTPRGARCRLRGSWLAH